VGTVSPRWRDDGIAQQPEQFWAGDWDQAGG
jgi:hypothetical protein